MAEWRDVPGFEGFYKVSDDGRIKSSMRRGSSGQEVKSHLRRDGYLYVCLYKDGNMKQQGVHRVVAKAFIPNPDNKREVNHKNLIKTDNRAENLEWVTPAENSAHATAFGVNDERIAKQSKPIIAIDKVTGEVKKYPSARAASRELDIFQSTISRKANRTSKWESKSERYVFVYAPKKGVEDAEEDI